MHERSFRCGQPLGRSHLVLLEGSCNPIAVSRAYSGEYVDQIAKGGALRANITRRSDGTSKSSKATCSGQRALPHSRRPPNAGRRQRPPCLSICCVALQAAKLVPHENVMSREEIIRRDDEC